MRTAVGIIGGGPAGLTLALLLHEAGVEAVVLEARSRQYVERRVRAGLLEQNTIDVLEKIGVDSRMHREGVEHSGISLRFAEQVHHLNVMELTGRRMMIYGQQEIVKDEIAAVLERDIPIFFEASEVAIHDIDSDHPSISFTRDGEAERLDCDFVAGCDGYHGVSRKSIPAGVRKELEHAYPFSWLGLLAAAPPLSKENLYAQHEAGFALQSMRGHEVSRLYLQVSDRDSLDEWPEERIWEQLGLRLGRVNEGPIIERSITTMRSFVSEPMQYRRLFLAGDAAHVVPPTGAKGLNLAINDARLLGAALASHQRDGDDRALADYSSVALRRVWRAQEFSKYMTEMLHDYGDDFQQRVQRARLEYATSHEAGAKTLAENYVGLPASADF
ncbi:MAG TPA: 4-hydroxybenzoate 3-monooxygenase [Solirubrobacterales bacterium]|nr:4-hydroxybenzoate 3-monooxygenase [Solirubrobacterales bacterium]